jgi:hypothetical protein
MPSAGGGREEGRVRPALATLEANGPLRGPFPECCRQQHFFKARVYAPSPLSGSAAARFQMSRQSQLEMIGRDQRRPASRVRGDSRPALEERADKTIGRSCTRRMRVCYDQAARRSKQMRREQAALPRREGSRTRSGHRRPCSSPLRESTVRRLVLTVQLSQLRPERKSSALPVCRV